VTTPTAPPPPGILSHADLRDAVEFALTNTPAKHAADRGGQIDTHGTEHRYNGSCALCRGEADTLTDAVINLMGDQNPKPHADEAARIVRAFAVRWILKIAEEGYAKGFDAFDEQGKPIRMTPEHLLTVVTDRMLAIAHDRQPYPTPFAYEQACEALRKHRERADAAEARVDALRALPERLRVTAAAAGPNPDARRAALREAALLIDKALIDTAPNPLTAPEVEG